MGTTTTGNVCCKSMSQVDVRSTFIRMFTRWGQRTPFQNSIHCHCLNPKNSMACTPRYSQCSSLQPVQLQFGASGHSQPRSAKQIKTTSQKKKKKTPGCFPPFKKKKKKKKKRKK